MRRSLVAAAAGLALATAGLAACDEQPERDDSGISPGDEYVALGDSYTAAPGTGELAAEDGCSQTVVNYPHLVAEAANLTLTDNSCNGANTTHLTRAKPGTDRGPQLNGVDEGTDLVTLRMGANDYELFFRIFVCADGEPFGADAPGTPCADFDASGGANSLDNRLPDVQRNLDRAVGAIEERAPDARIILIGYPHLAPAKGTCELLPLPEGDYDYARRVVDGVNEALEAVADDHDLTYIDMEGPSEGHDICGEEPWMAGPDPERGATAWHPYAVESETVAALVLEELEEPEE